jgi:hypothetical protein
MANANDYTKRIDQFTKWKKVTKNKILGAEYDKSITLTQESLEVCDLLIKSIENAYNIYNDVKKSNIALFDKILKNRIATYKKLEKDIKNAKKDLTIEELKIQKIGIDSFDFQIDYLLNQYSLEDAKFLSALKLQNVLFEKILRPSQKEFSQKLVIDSIEASIGLIPIVGPFFDGIKRIIGLNKFQQQKSKKADEHLNYLQDYKIAIYNWILTTKKMIASLDSLKEFYEMH